MSDRPDLFLSVPRTAFDAPGRSRGLLDVFQLLDMFRWHYLLRLLVHVGVTTRYRNSVLGWTWSYVRPAAQFSGIVVINLFSEVFKNATTSIMGNAPLIVFDGDIGSAIGLMEG